MEELKNFDQLPDSAFIRMATVQALLGGAARQTVERWIRDGVFPRGVAISGAYRAWQVGEVRRFLAEKQAAGAPRSIRSPNGAKGGKQVKVAA